MKPVFFDGLVYVLIQVLMILSTQFGTDEAAKYIEPQTLFWVKIAVGELGAAVMAIKMYRSETFANWKRNGGDKPPVMAQTILTASPSPQPPKPNDPTE